MTQTLFTYAQAKPLAVAAAALLAVLALRWAWRIVCAERRRGTAVLAVQGVLPWILDGRNCHTDWFGPNGPHEEKVHRVPLGVSQST